MMFVNPSQHYNTQIIVYNHISVTCKDYSKDEDFNKSLDFWLMLWCTGTSLPHALIFQVSVFFLRLTLVLPHNVRSFYHVSIQFPNYNPLRCCWWSWFPLWRSCCPFSILTPFLCMSRLLVSVSTHQCFLITTLYDVADNPDSLWRSHCPFSILTPFLCMSRLLVPVPTHQCFLITTLYNVADNPNSFFDVLIAHFRPWLPPSACRACWSLYPHTSASSSLSKSNII